MNPLTDEPGFSVPSWTCQHRCCPCCWPGLCARRLWWLCRAWVFIAVLYTSLAPSHSGWGSCHFDVVPVSRPASGLHMEGRASEPAHTPHPMSPLLLLRSCSRSQHLPDSVFPPGAWHLEGLGNLELGGSSRGDTGNPGTCLLSGEKNFGWVGKEHCFEPSGHPSRCPRSSLTARSPASKVAASAQWGGQHHLPTVCC